MPSDDGKVGQRTSIRNHQPGRFCCSAVIAAVDSSDGEEKGSPLCFLVFNSINHFPLKCLFEAKTAASRRKEVNCID